MPLHDPVMPVGAPESIDSSSSDMDIRKRRHSIKSPSAATEKDGKRRKILSAVQVQAERRQKSTGGSFVQVPDSQGNTTSISPRKPVLAVGLNISRISEGPDSIPRRSHLLSPDSSEGSRSPNVEEAVEEALNRKQEAKAIILTWFWRGMFSEKAKRMIGYTKEQLGVAELGEFAEEERIIKEIDVLMQGVRNTRNDPFVKQVTDWQNQNPDPDPHAMDRESSWFKGPPRSLPVEEGTPAHFDKIHGSVEELVPSMPTLLNGKPPKKTENDEELDATKNEKRREERDESPSKQLEREITSVGKKDAALDNRDDLEYPHYIKYGIDSKFYTIIGRADQHHEFPDNLMPRIEESWKFILRFSQEYGPLKYLSEYQKLDNIPVHDRHKRLVFVMEHMGICIATMKGIHYPYWAKNGRFKINVGVPVFIKEEHTWQPIMDLHRKLKAVWKEQQQKAKNPNKPPKGKAKPVVEPKRLAEPEEFEDQIIPEISAKKSSTSALSTVTVNKEGLTPARSLLTPPSPVRRVTRQHPRSEIPETPEPDVPPADGDARKPSLTPFERVLTHRPRECERSPSPSEIYRYTDTPWVIPDESEDSGKLEDEDESAGLSTTPHPPRPPESMETSSLLSPAPSTSVSSDTQPSATIPPPRHIRKRPNRQFPTIQDYTKSLPIPKPKLPTEPPTLNIYLDRLNERETTLLGQLSQLEAQFHDLAIKHAKQRNRFQNPLFATNSAPSCSSDEIMGDVGVNRSAGSRSSSRFNPPSSESFYKVEERRELYLDYLELRKKQQMEAQRLEKRQEDVLQRLAEVANDRDRTRERFDCVNESLMGDSGTKTVSGKILEELEIEEWEEEESEHEKGLSRLVEKNMADMEGIGVKMWKDLVEWGEDGLRMDKEAERMAERLRSQQQGGAGSQANVARKKRRKKMNW